ncbi:hypothetical protein MRB53_027198 [Persea americana]|uniref:Uncharacterized protein n=1 Tax=Persea americana TaxID=3435 RepID=A0ACC2LKB4_PERAE|nr:hypothetical protein MRB53_027198 [Persea americana]
MRSALASLLASLLASVTAFVFAIYLLGVLMLGLMCFFMLFLMLVILIALYFFPRVGLMILCAAIFLFLLDYFFYDDEEDLLNKDSYDSTAVFNVATRIEKIYGGKVYVGLRIPDPDSKSRVNIDMVLITKGSVMVVSVWNFTGSVDIDKDGSWVGIEDQQHKKKRHPSLVNVTKRRAVILASYLKLRGVTLPKGYLIGRVVLSDPNCRVTHAIECLPEVISFNKWSQLKPEPHLKKQNPEPEPEPAPKSGFSNWFKAAFQGGKNDTQELSEKKKKNDTQEQLKKLNDAREEMHQKLHFILSTAPMWDRLELKGNRNILGEFMKFKGKQEDTSALGNVKRSKVSRLVIQKSFGDSDGLTRRVLYAPRDYRSEGASASEQMKATVQSSTEIVFQPLNSKKMGKIKLSSIVSVSLSG